MSNLEISDSEVESLAEAGVKYWDAMENSLANLHHSLRGLVSEGIMAGRVADNLLSFQAALSVLDGRFASLGRQVAAAASELSDDVARIDWRA